jgi:hypothetical protein
MKKVLRIVVSRENKTKKLERISDETVEILTELPLLKFKEKLKQERNLTDEYNIDLTYMEV